MGYSGTKNILCSLSKMVHGNVDVIEYIYKKKKMIETNENLLYYLLTGLQNDSLYSYTLFSFHNTTKIIYDSITEGNIVNDGCIFSSSGEDRIKSYRVDKEPIPEGFLKTFMLNKIHYGWDYSSSKILIKNQKWCQKIMLDALFLPSFIFIRVIPGFTSTSFQTPTLKQKIKALNRIVKERGYLYLDLIKEEFKEDYHSAICIILDINGDIESIYGELFI